MLLDIVQSAHAYERIRECSGKNRVALEYRVFLVVAGEPGKNLLVPSVTRNSLFKCWVSQLLNSMNGNMFLCINKKLSIFICICPDMCIFLLEIATIDYLQCICYIHCFSELMRLHFCQ